MAAQVRIADIAFVVADGAPRLRIADIAFVIASAPQIRIADIAFHVTTLPTAVLTADVTSGGFPLTVNFDASGSSDPVDQSLTYAWNYGDGTTVPGSPTNQVQHTYTTAGTRTATVTVTNDNGGTATASVTITIGSTLYRRTFAVVNGGVAQPIVFIGIVRSGVTRPVKFLGVVESGALVDPNATST